LRDGSTGEQAKQYRLLSLIIDGDHSYDGVKNDWINYSPLVVPGGYVLLDDYNGHCWPEVAGFANKEVLSNLCGRWDVVLAYGSSLVLRRTDLEPTEETDYSQMLVHNLAGAQRTIEDQKRRLQELKAEVERLKKLEAKVNLWKQIPKWLLRKRRKQ
jgi:hypothetical protein